VVLEDCWHVMYPCRAKGYVEPHDHPFDVFYVHCLLVYLLTNRSVQILSILDVFIRSVISLDLNIRVI